MPLSPSMNVIADLQEAVFMKPLSRATRPVVFSTAETSKLDGSSVPSTASKGSWPPGYSRV
jgi:hypothetical protein